MHRLLITPGDPAGIGLDLALELATIASDDELVLVCDPTLLMARAHLLQRDIRIDEIQLLDDPSHTALGVIKVIPVMASSAALPGQPDPSNSAYVIACLDVACDACLAGQADALVTGPINKAIIKGHYGEVYKNKDSLYITKHASIRYKIENDSYELKYWALRAAE